MNGRGQSFRWREIEGKVKKRIGHECTSTCFKYKYDSTRKDWRLWKQLKQSETGLGWDPISGKIKVSPEWWTKKIKENKDIKKFREKGMDSLLEEKWDQLFGDSYATGENVYVPTMEPPIVNIEEDGDDNQGKNQLEDMIGEEDNRQAYNLNDDIFSQPVFTNEENGNFFKNFYDHVSKGDAGSTLVTIQGGSTQVKNQGGIVGAEASKKLQKSQLKINPIQMKRNRRQSLGSAMLSAHLSDMVSCCKKMIEDGPSSVKTQAPSTISMAMQIFKRMVSDHALKKGSVVWCHTLSVLEDEAKREIFINLKDNDSRLTWLNYLCRMKDN